MHSAQLEQLKSDYLDHLYAQSGRTSGLYTGLWAEHCRTAGERERLIWNVNPPI
jgi:hypothetical protein